MATSEDLARRFELQLGSWAAALGDPASPALDRPASPGKWSARENLAHIARMHGVYEDRITRIRSEESPRMPAYRAEEDPEWEQWRALAVPELLERVRRARAELVSDVRGLSEAELARIGVHSRLGPLSLEEWLNFFLLHEGHHLYVILKLLRVA
jgi:hypothetical protein